MESALSVIAWLRANSVMLSAAQRKVLFRFQARAEKVEEALANGREVLLEPVD